MTGIIYQLSDNRIIAIIPDVLEVTETSIKGQSHEVRGIDISKANISVVNPFSVTVEHEDVTVEVPGIEEIDGVPTPVMKPEVIGQLEVIKVVLTEGGPEIGEGDTFDPALLPDERAQLPLTPEQEIAMLKQGIAELTILMAGGI